MVSIDNKPTCLVTGSNGFIGRHLVQKLNNLGWKVISSSSKTNNITNFANLKRLFNLYNFDYVFHLASQGNQMSISESDINIFRTNVIGTYNLLSLLPGRGIQGFINIGASNEYGICKDKMCEKISPAPRFFFAGTKAAATMMATSMAYNYNLPIVTLRPFSVYGPGDNNKRFIPTAVKSALNNSFIEIHPGKHDWIYIDDVVYAIFEFAKIASKLKGEIVNVGTGKETTNFQVIRLIEKITGKKIRIIKSKKKLRSFDSNRWVADIGKLKTLINWKPINLEKGLIKTIEAV